MNQYVNGFHCAYHNGRDEVVIYFRQERPTGVKDDDQQLIIEPVADLVMDKSIALELASLITHLCGDADDLIE